MKTEIVVLRQLQLQHERAHALTINEDDLELIQYVYNAVSIYTMSNGYEYMCVLCEQRQEW